MRSSSYDAIVIGVGGMGSAAVYHLAKRGARVLGLERFDIPHTFGSSHGSTRIIRLAYSEGSHYVPLLRDAYRLWRELEEVSGESILRVTGGLDIGHRNSEIVEGSRASCLDHDIEFEELDAGEVNRRFPGYALPPEMCAIYQSDGGYLHSETAIRTHAAAARALGAEIVTGARVLGWDTHAGMLRVATGDARYEARKLVITAGPWAGELAPALQRICRPVRQVMLWTEPLAPAAFAPERFPVFVLESPVGNFYGYPDDHGEGFKIGKFHHLWQDVPDPDVMDRECHPEDEAVLREGIAAYVPRANGPLRRMAACIFTNSPDGHFILDRHPDHEDVFLAAGFSGHGFKFCSVVGRIAADACLERPLQWDLSSFGLAAKRASRLAHAPAGSEGTA
jgi:sarcosine oxidase